LHLEICLTFSHDSDRLVVARGELMTTRDLATSVGVATFQQSSTIDSVSLSPDGMSIAIASNDKLNIWQMDRPIQSPSEVADWHSGRVTSIAISPDSTFLASGSGDKMVKLWNSVTGACIHTFNDHSDSVRCVAIFTRRVCIVRQDSGVACS
jgi:WD40 repeat protein